MQILWLFVWKVGLFQAIKWHKLCAQIIGKSAHLANMIEMHGETFTSEGKECLGFTLGEVEPEVVTALISYLKDFPLRECGVILISCDTAISLIAIGRKYRMPHLEHYICQLILEEREPLWFDIKSIVNLFRFCCCQELDKGAEIRLKLIQALQT